MNNKKTNFNRILIGILIIPKYLKFFDRLIYIKIFKILGIIATFLILNDAPQPWQIGFQDSAAPGFSGIVELHNTLIILFIVLLFNYNLNISLNLLDFLVLSKRSHEHGDGFPNKRFKESHLTENDSPASGGADKLENEQPDPAESAGSGGLQESGPASANQILEEVTQEVTQEVTDEDLLIQTALMGEIHENSKLIKSTDTTDEIKGEAINRIISLSRQYVERGGLIYDLELGGLLEEETYALETLREALGPDTSNDGTNPPQEEGESSESDSETQESNDSISIEASGRPKGTGAGGPDGGGPSAPPTEGAGPQSGGSNFCSIQDLCLYLLILFSSIMEHLDLLLEHLFNKFS